MLGVTAIELRGEVIVPDVVAWRGLLQHCCWLRNLLAVGLGACYRVELCPLGARCQAEEDLELSLVMDLPYQEVDRPCLVEDLPFLEVDRPCLEEVLPFEAEDLPYQEVVLSSCLEADLQHLEVDQNQVAMEGLFPCLEAVPCQDVVPFPVVGPFPGLEAVPYQVSDHQPSCLVEVLPSFQAAVPASSFGLPYLQAVVLLAFPFPSCPEAVQLQTFEG